MATWLLDLGHPTTRPETTRRAPSRVVSCRVLSQAGLALLPNYSYSYLLAVRAVRAATTASAAAIAAIAAADVDADADADARLALLAIRDFSLLSAHFSPLCSGLTAPHVTYRFHQPPRSRKQERC